LYPRAFRVDINPYECFGVRLPIVERMSQTRFITLEGGEGVGKSTLMRGLCEWLTQRGITVRQTREPGGTPIADAIRQLFKSPPGGEAITAEAEALLVSAARTQHVINVIRPFLHSGNWVICDRFADSTRVYQGLFGGVPLNELEWLIKFSTAGLEPDLTFLLDCDVSLSAQRIGGRKSGGEVPANERYDNAAQHVHDRLREGFRKVAGFYPSRFFILDASRSKDDVLRQACTELERRWQL
jgi:dTMP kinase